MNRRITELFTKKLAQEASKEELMELEELLRSNPSEQYLQEMIGNWWYLKQKINADASQLQDKHFQYIIKKSAEGSEDKDINADTPVPVINISRKKRLYRFAYAAVLAGIIFLGAWKFLAVNKPLTENKKQVQENEIVAKRGTKSKLLLPDGTQVWLNSESRLIYTSTFNDTVREVTLEGEAYFDVVKDAKKPFIVHTSGIDIRVLGTAFNVKSYPFEATIEATLIRGLIEVKKNNEPRTSKILLQPNEKLIFNKIQNKVSLSSKSKEEDAAVSTKTDMPIAQLISISTLPKNLTDSTRIETSWVYGKLLFEGDTFRDLAKKMERWFNVKITFRNDKVANYRFGGVFENENIKEALQALQLTASFKYNITDDEVVIDKK